MIQFLLAVIVLLVLVHLLHYAWNREFYHLNLPGPVAWPFVGNAHMYLGRTKETSVNLFHALVSKWPTPLRFWLGPKCFVVINKPEDVQIVLNSQHCMDHADVYNFGRHFIGEGLLLLKNPAWKEHRRLLNPCFSLRILQSFIPIFNAEVQTMVERLKLQAKKGDTFDMYEYMSACTLDMVCQTSMGTEMNIQKNQNVDFIQAGKMLFKITMRRMFKPWYHSDFIYKTSKMYREQQKWSNIFHGFAKNIIQNKKETNSPIPEEETEGPLKKPQIYIDQLLKLEGGPFNDWDVLSEVLTLMAAGYETTAVEVSYIILMLAMHPEYQERVFAEVKLLFPEKNPVNSLNYEDLINMEFTERVIKETLRLFPSIPITSRKSTSAFDLNGIRVPEGCTIIVSPVLIHRDEKLWGPNTMKFDPDHFLVEKCEKRHPYSFIPFSAGPRNCIGHKYAMISMKVILAHLIRNFRFTTDLKLDELRVELGISLKLMNKHLVRVTERVD